MHWLVIVLIAALVANAGVVSLDIFTRRQSQVQRSASPGKTLQTPSTDPEKLRQILATFDEMRQKISIDLERDVRESQAAMDEATEQIRRLRQQQEGGFARELRWPAPQ